MHQDDRGDHDDSCGGSAAGRQVGTAVPRRRTAGTSHRPGAGAPTPPSPRHPRAGSSHGGSQATRRVPPPVSQRCSSAHLLGGGPAQRPGPGQHASAAPARSASTTGIGGTPRRATPAAASRPWRTTASSQPPLPVRAGPDQLREARERGQPLRPAERPDQPGEPVAAAGGRLEPLPRRQRGDLVREGVQRAVVRAVDQLPPGRDRRARSPSTSWCPAHGAAQRRSSCSAHGPAAAPRAGMRSVHGRSGTASSTVSTASRASRCERNGPSAPVARCRHHRQPRERLGRGRHPPRRVRVAGAAVVAGPVRGDQPQLAHGGLQRVRAHDRVDPLGLGDHVADAPPALARGEVAAHPAPQVAAGADVEHLVAGAAEQVHPGRGRHRTRPGGACGAGAPSAGAARRRGPA